MSAPVIVAPTISRPQPRARRWAVTVAATAASMYALDAVATGSGVLLAASGVFGGVEQRILLLFLAASYVLWGAGLRVNLQANWALLEETGTSTNALSKGSYDLVTRRRGSIRARKIASAMGYLGTELVKEVPYYAGALGAARLSDSVSTSDALIFLVGANLGAAAYEYGLGHVTRLLLRRKSRGLLRPAVASLRLEAAAGSGGDLSHLTGVYACPDLQVEVSLTAGE